MIQSIAFALNSKTSSRHLDDGDGDREQGRTIFEPVIEIVGVCAVIPIFWHRGGYAIDDTYQTERLIRRIKEREREKD